MSARRAAQEFAKLVEEDPTNVKLLAQWGDACQRAGDHVTAAEAYSRIGDFFARDGFFLKAVALMKQVIKLDPGRNDINFRLVDLHLKLGLVNEAISYFRIAINSANLRADRTSLVTMMEMLISAQPSEPEWRLYFAQALLFSGEKEAARTSLESAAHLLRTEHPDLAAAVARIVLAEGTESIAAEIAAVRAIRHELFKRVNAVGQLAALDFKQPN